MKKGFAHIVLITFTLSFSFLSFGQRNTDIGLSLSSDKDQRLVFEYRKPIKEKWRMTLGAAYGHYNYRSVNTIISFTDTTAVSQNHFARVNKGSVRIGADRQFGNSMFSIGGDLVLHYQTNHRGFSNIEYTKDSTGISPPTYFSSFSPTGSATSYKIHYLGAGLQLTGKMDVPLSEKFSLNLFAGALISVNSSFRIDNIIDSNNELDWLESRPNISYLDFNLVAGIGLKYAFGK